MRLGVEGEFGDNYSYVLTGDFADPEGALVQDGYFDITFNDAFQLRAGQFKAPFSQETLQSDNRIMFVERSSLSNLAPSRTPGLMLSGSLINGRLSYNVDAYNGRGRVSSNDTSTPEIGARLRFQPFRGSELFENLAFGGAYTQGRHLDGSSFAGRTASRSVTFFRRIPIRGKTTRTNAEFEWVTSQFSMRGEYMQTNQARDGLGPNGNNLPGVVAKGYMVEAGYVLGGTNQSNALVVPRTTFRSTIGRIPIALMLTRSGSTGNSAASSGICLIFPSNDSNIQTGMRASMKTTPLPTSGECS
jgi:phosphate-selective porin